MTVEPEWLAIARAEIGVRETPGKESTPRVLEYLRATKLPPSMYDDETPWCSALACWVMERAGIASPRSAGARSWLRWGMPMVKPRLGCIVVLSRPSSDNPHAGHVGFYVGQGDKGPRILGGNQRDSVSVREYPSSRVLGYRWPEVP